MHGSNRKLASIWTIIILEIITIEKYAWFKQNTPQYLEINNFRFNYIMSTYIVLFCILPLEIKIEEYAWFKKTTGQYLKDHIFRDHYNRKICLVQTKHCAIIKNNFFWINYIISTYMVLFFVLITSFEPCNCSYCIHL